MRSMFAYNRVAQYIAVVVIKNRAELATHFIYFFFFDYHGIIRFPHRGMKDCLDYCSVFETASCNISKNRNAPDEKMIV